MASCFAGAAPGAGSFALGSSQHASTPKQVLPVALPSAAESGGGRGASAVYDRSLDGIDAEYVLVSASSAAESRASQGVELAGREAQAQAPYSSVGAAGGSITGNASAEGCLEADVSAYVALQVESSSW